MCPAADEAKQALAWHRAVIGHYRTSSPALFVLLRHVGGGSQTCREDQRMPSLAQPDEGQHYTAGGVLLSDVGSMWLETLWDVLGVR